MEGQVTAVVYKTIARYKAIEGDSIIIHLSDSLSFWILHH